MGKRKKNRRFLKLSNKWIVILKILSACALLFISGVFFFQNINVFGNDFRSWNLAPIIFFLGIGFCCFYIGFLINRMEARELHRAERWDLAYKIIYSIVLLYIGLRDFFVEPYLDVSVWLIITTISIGLLNWVIPPLRFHDDTDF